VKVVLSESRIQHIAANLAVRLSVPFTRLQSHEVQHGECLLSGGTASRLGRQSCSQTLQRMIVPTRS
jgi:hypothetical protein